MNAAAAEPAATALPAWLVAGLFGLLVLPFHPYWLDFEQVRRGLLLVLTGGCLLAMRSLRPVRGEAFVWAFVGGLVASGGIQWLTSAWFVDAKATATFQPWDAVYRVAHWLALLVVLRLGALAGAGGRLPLAVLLALTSAFGLLQRLGLGEIAGYGVEREPVSVFGNLNVAAEWTAVAATALGASWEHFAKERQRAIAIAAMALAGGYLVVDQSRSGLVALPVGLALLGLLRWRQGGLLPLAVAAAGAAGGAVVELALPRPAPGDATAARAELQRGTQTLAVRFEIAKGTAQLFAQSPVYGLGPGQFAVHYPRVRSQEEIEISSHGRQFPTEVRTAHDDWLELLVDGGLLALALFAAMLFALQRAQPDKARLLPLFVLLLLMLVRAPLWNAPAAAAAFWLCGVPGDAARPVARWQRRLSIALGLVLVGLGVPVLVANQLGAGYQRAIARGEQPQLADVAAAAAWMPFEPRWLEILTREKLARGDLPGAAVAGARALRLRPHHPQLYLNLGEVLAKGTKFPEARAVARQGLDLDPQSPELRVLDSTVQAQQGDVEGAIATVAHHPHPVLRAQLANHFLQLARVCRDRGNERGAARFGFEHHVVAAIDGCGDQNPGMLAATKEHIEQAISAMGPAGLRDARPIVLTALFQLDSGNLREAIGLGETVQRFPPLLPWQRELFGAQLDRLRPLASWQPFFGAR